MQDLQFEILIKLLLKIDERLMTISFLLVGAVVFLGMLLWVARPRTRITVL